MPKCYVVQAFVNSSKGNTKSSSQGPPRWRLSLTACRWALEKRSSEVWTLLSAVKTEFGKFVEVLEKTQKKLQEASNTIETATRKSRTIARKLKNVQTLPANETDLLLGQGIEHEE